MRQRVDDHLGYLLVAAITGLCLLGWGPIPLVGLWIGSEVGHLSGSIFLDIVLAFTVWFVVIHGPGSMITPGAGENPGWPG